MASESDSILTTSAAKAESRLSGLNGFCGLFISLGMSGEKSGLEGSGFRVQEDGRVAAAFFHLNPEC
jgi:hypothetical protein